MLAKLILILTMGGVLAIHAAAPATHSLAPKIFQWRPFLAPFHAVVLHLPIGFLTVAFLQEIYLCFRPSKEVRRLTGWMLLASLLSGGLAATFGLMRAESGGYEAHALELHRNYGYSVLGFAFATLLAHGWCSRCATLKFRSLVYRGLLIITLGLLVRAGHYGGNLTHGSRYLVENAPDFVREFFDESKDPLPVVGSPSELGQAYVSDVKPILSSHCYGCHGAEKQKGGYRLDTPERAVQAGASGKIPIKPRDPLESHLVRLILLPEGHDDVMPPDGKKPLEPAEIGRIIEWIRKGAVFGASAD